MWVFGKEAASGLVHRQGQARLLCPHLRHRTQNQKAVWGCNLASEGPSQGAPAHVGPPSLVSHPPRFLSAGYRWERQLVFRSKLTMHTAFDRKDNAHPAEITALGVSK